VAVDSVMVDPVGASRGTFSQARPKPARTMATPRRRVARRARVTMKTLNILVAMKLGGQAPRASARNSGYAMVALLVAMSIMAVMMTVAMPVWKQNVQREKEEELIFRGKQYMHAITLFGRKFANQQPPNLDVLVEQRFLRKKYKDPITNQDFDVIRANQAQPGAVQPGTVPGRGGSTGSASITNIGAGGQASPQAAGRGTSPIGTPGAGPAGGITGVASKSKDKSIRIYNGRTHYNEWQFVYQPPQQTPGAGAPGVGVPGQRGGQGQQPGGPGPIGGQRGRGGFPGSQGPAFPGSPTGLGAPPGRGRG